MVLIAGLVSQTGDWILRVGLTYQIYVLTGSTLASASMLVASFLPQILLGSVAGVFVDRWDRRRTMIGSNLILAVGLLPLLLVTGTEQIGLVFVVLLWEGVVQQFFLPAMKSLVPHLVDERQLITANALIGQTRDVSRLVGSAIGGVTVAIGGMTLLTVVDAVSCLLAAAVIASVWTRDGSLRAQRPGREQLRQRLVQLRAEWTDGLLVAARQPVLRVIMVFLLVTTLGEGVMGTLFAPFVHDALGGTSQQYGAIISAQAVGGIVGGLIAGSLGEWIRPGPLLGWAAVAFGTIDLVIFIYPVWFQAVWPAVVGMVVVGLPGAMVMAGVTTLLQRNTPAGHRGRVFGAVGALEGLSIMVGAAAAGALGDGVGLVPVLIVQAAGYLLSGVVVLLALPQDTPQHRTANI
ncbi:MAG: MFS transporter [Propionibacteriaceae bacterium]